MSDWRNKVDLARWWLIQNQPYYGALAMRLIDAEAPPSVKAAATDGKRIFWSPDFVEGLSVAETRFVLMHETMHCAHQHFWRLPMNEKANIAEDHAINLILLDLAAAGADIAMPNEGIADPQYRGLCEEEIYALLPDDAGDGYADGVGGMVEPSTDPGDAAAQKEAWTQAVIQAAMVAKAARGAVPAEAERLIAKALARRVDWRQELSDFVCSAASVRNDWARPARRHATARAIVPRRAGKALKTIVFVRDTSGSVSDATLADVNACVAAALAQTGASAVVIDCDARVNAEYVLAPGEAPPETAKGGGGTDFRPAFERAAEIDDIAGVVYLTDGAGTFPACFDYPTLWVLSAPGVSVPFGRALEISQ